MASWREMRERQRVRARLYKGEPVREDDGEWVRQVLTRLRWARPLALYWVVLGGVFLWIAIVAHGTLRWTAITWLFVCALWTFGQLRQRKRIVAGATRLGFRLDG